MTSEKSQFVTMDNNMSALFLFLCLQLITPVVISASDTINTTQFIRDGDTLISARGFFQLGFFSSGSPNKRYLGIWYNNMSPMTLVWVANRDAPLNDTSGTLRLTSQGILVLLNRNGSIVWSSNSSTSATNPVAQLLDSSNLVVRDASDENPEDFLWQSFDYIGDTLMPGMKFGRNITTGQDWYMTSWKATDDPGTGNFTFRFEPKGYPEIILREGSIKRFRPGPWDGVRFSGMPQVRSNPIYAFTYVLDTEEVYYKYRLLNESTFSRLVVGPNGNVLRLTWNDRTRNWVLYLTAQTDNCDRYALCGAYGSCDISNSPACNCLKGFVPKNPRNWALMDWSGGCVRSTPLNCSGDGFQKYTEVKMPETLTSWFNKSMTLDECNNMCMKNCSCTAYSNMDIRAGGSGCLLWFGELTDIRQFNENTQEIYIRMAASDLDNGEVKIKSSKKNHTKILIGSLLAAGVLLLVLALLFYLWKHKHRRNGSMKDDLELPLFDLDTIATATNNFAMANKLGQGGYGPVYQGRLKDGQEIAVKRLSKNSRQGHDEFKNEVKHIVKLQHRNLVKLLGCCIQEDEKMLIYEFMPNKSLDFFLYDPVRNKQLDWPKRYNIINGIARGLLYLHQDSRLRIIHRDLKASNVLLDREMIPKISDFGLARSFGGNETEVNTNKVAGTYGYISPEYAIDGLYSVKSDVFSFGVIVIEIVTGRRNRGFRHAEHNLNLIGHAWRLFKEERSQELIAESVLESCNLAEVLRSIHVGLLCVQCSPKDRPTMSTVAYMFASEGELPQPKQPGFFNEREVEDVDASSSQNKPFSANEFTVTLLEAR